MFFLTLRLKTFLLTYIFEDIKGRADLAFSWLYEEYCFYQGFNKASSMYNRRTDDSEYNHIFSHLIRGVIDRCDGDDREALLRRLYLESPIITEEAIHILKEIVTAEVLSRVYFSRNLLFTGDNQQIKKYYDKIKLL